MPLWKIYHPEHAFTSEDKQAIAQRITGIYRMLPKFLCRRRVSGHPEHVVLRWRRTGIGLCAHLGRSHIIARSFDSEELKARFLTAVDQLPAPFITDRGLRRETHVDETPFSLWTIQGLRPPLPDTPAEKRWLAENRPNPSLAETT